MIPRISDPADFGRVAVVYGGNSAEREVSLDSGQGVLSALRSRRVDAHGVDGIPELLQRVARGEFARVFNILHGRGGEDGSLQGALDCLGVPYTGSGILGSALSMDKDRTKQVWKALGLPTPGSRILRPGDDAGALIREVGLPVIVKPVHEGSSVGVTKVREYDQVADAIALASRYDGELLVEELVLGPEYTVGILQGEALPAIQIVPASDFYDYHAKYVADDTRYLIPCGLDSAREAELKRIALSAFHAVGAAGWGRVDVMADDRGFWLLEVNTTPGMTSHSLVPKAAAAVGIDYAELCWRVLETSFESMSA